MSSKEKVLLLWIDENKTGIEDLKNIPEECRFEGCIAPVVWRGDKEAYPAKVVKISDNLGELEFLETSLLMKLLPSNSKRKRESAKPGKEMASDREVSKALGERAPIPASLSSTKTKIKQAIKKTTKALSSAQTAIDKELLQTSSVQAPIRQPAIVGHSKTKVKKSDPVHRNQDASDGETDKEDQYMDADILEETKGDLLPALSEIVTCSCGPCKKMAMFANNTCRAMLSTMLDLLSDETKDRKYLKLQEIKDGEPVGELTKNSGIYIPLSTKNQLKVDCKSNPKKLVKETLFALYGQNAFKQGNVTAKGTKGYGIDPKVLSATLGFVNRNSAAGDRLKSSEIITYINKRIGDWRSPPKSLRGTQTARKKLFSPPPTSTITSTITGEGDIESEVSDIEKGADISVHTPLLNKEVDTAGSPPPQTTGTPAPSTSLKVTTPVKQGCPPAVTAAGIPTFSSPLKNWPAPPSAIPAQPGYNAHHGNYLPYHGSYPPPREPAPYNQPPVQIPPTFHPSYGHTYNWPMEQHQQYQQQWTGSAPAASPGFQYYQMPTVPRSTADPE